jgi:hypothetical protein
MMRRRRQLFRTIAALAIAMLLWSVPPHVFSRGLLTPAASLTELNPGPGSVMINEFMAMNRTGLKDEDGETSDWIELYNSGTSPVNLAGWSLTDARYQPRRWVFPAVILDAQSYLVIFASGKDRRPTDPSAALHTNFKLSAQGEHLALYNAANPPQMVDGFTPRFPIMPADVSLGRAGRAREFRYFAQPTPGGPNDEASAIQLQSELRLAITAPKPGEIVSGVVKVKGFSDTRGFRKWQLDLLPGANADRAIYLAHDTLPAPVKTELFKLDTRLYPDGDHALRLRAVRADGNYDEVTAPFTIANGAAR